MNPPPSRHQAATAPTLPVLSTVWRRALSLLDDTRPLEHELTQLVEIDIALTGTILRVVRCPLFREDQPDENLGRALVRVGRPMLRHLFETLPRVDGRQVREEVERACRYWVHSLASGAAARWLANMGAYEYPEEAYMAAQVSDLGWLLARPGDDWHSVGRRMEHMVVGWRLQPRVVTVSRLRWQAPGFTQRKNERASLDRSTRRLAAVVEQGTRVATALGYGTGEADASATLPPEFDTAGVDEAIELELAHAATLLQLPSAPGYEFLRILTNEELRHATALEEAEVEEPGPQDLLQGVADVHRRMVAARGTASVSDILGKSLEALFDGTPFERLLLLEREPGRRDVVRGRMVLDPTRHGEDRGARGLVVPIDPHGAVQRALTTGQAQLGSHPQTDAITLEHLGVDSFVVAPLRASAADLGVVVADNFFSRRALDHTDVAILGMLCASLGLVVENTALDAQGRKLRSLAEKDELTGINNRRNLLQTLQKEVDRARRYGKPLSACMIDVDRFKRWNDIFGHQVGDTVLQEVAQLISSCSREIDCYGRYGGEEFMVVLPETQLQDAVFYAERVRATVEEHGDELAQTFDGNTLSVSIGVTCLVPRGDDMVSMIQRADEALYAAKKNGRNRIYVQPADSPPYAAQLDAEAEAEAEAVQS